MNFVPQILAQEAPPPGGPGLMGFLPMILLLVAMYFLLIAPQRKKQKQHQQMVANLKSGDDVVTTGGIYGTITNIKEDRFVLKIAEGTKIEISKPSVAAVVSAQGDS